MLRLAAFALLGCSFLTVQAHVVRERTLSTPGIELPARPMSGSGPNDSKLPGLGGGTTRALHEASEAPGASLATPSLASALPVGSTVWTTVAPLELPRPRGLAPPILRI